MTTGMDWQTQVGRSWAQMYPQTDRAFAGLTQRLLDRIAGYDGDTVLDVGCGAGELSIAIARSRSHAQVIGLDVSPDLIEVARQRGANHGNVEFVHGDALLWQRDHFVPQLLVSRHGVMFFDDPLAAFTHLRGISGSGAGLVFSCFRSPRENRWASDIADLLELPHTANLHVPGPFAFADPQYVEPILHAAGWKEIDFEPVDFAYIAGMGADPVDDASGFFSRIGPAAAALREIEGAAREQGEARIAEWLEAHRSNDLVAFAAAAWIVTAKA